MQQAQTVIKHMNQDCDPLRPFRRAWTRIGEDRLDQFDVPVAQLVPNELIDFTRSLMEPELIKGV